MEKRAQNRTSRTPDGAGALPIRGLCLVALFAAVCLFLVGCGNGKSSTTTFLTTPGTAAEATTTAAEPPTSEEEAVAVSSTTAASAMQAGSYAHEPAYLDTQAVELSAIQNLDKANLSEAQKQVLARQSFVAVDGDPTNGGWQFWQIYETARYAGIPLFVTTDSLLNAYHGLFDTLLQRMEEASLYKQAITMTEALYAAASDQWNEATDPAMKEEARRNMAYFSVANSLLKGAPTAADVVADDVEAELTLINGAAGIEESPLLGYSEDYTQYKPRGHYTRSETLQRYFKGMMWYGHTAFFINPRDPDITPEEADSLTRRAILIAASIRGTAKEAWTALYEPTSFLVGAADDLTADDVQLVLTDVFETANPEPDALADAAKVAAVRTALNQMPAPKILSATVRAEGDTTDREANERSFRVMGQRYIPDSYAFQQLVWAYVGENEPEKKRDMPMGLDVMTVLGSDQAYRIEKDDFTQDRYQNWESQIDKVNKEFSEKQGSLWPDNLYTGWLDSLQQVLAKPDDRAPAFMRTKVWARKSLNTALGSWTELRHDTILYAKQSVAAEGDGGEEQLVPGYVEPYPGFYGKIAELAGTLRESLTDYGLGDPEAADKLNRMVTLAQTLQAIAEKELAGEQLTEEEQATIEFYGHALEELEQFTDSEEGRTLSPSPEKSPVVADVHTSTISQQALEEGTGYPLTLYAAFQVNGQMQLFAGASYSYYEFAVPLAERLTDEEWIGRLDSASAPARPAWTNEWIAPK